MKLYTSKEAALLIKSFEGLSLIAYQCIGGYKTIGYGHKIRKEESYTKISKKKAEELFEGDLYSAEGSVLKNIKVPLKQHQFDALVSFTFNLGGAALQRSTIRQKINRYMFQEAKEEFKRWIYCSGSRSKGMIRRREIESALFAGKLELDAGIG